MGDTSESGLLVVAVGRDAAFTGGDATWPDIIVFDLYRGWGEWMRKGKMKLLCQCSYGLQERPAEAISSGHALSREVVERHS